MAENPSNSDPVGRCKIVQRVSFWSGTAFQQSIAFDAVNRQYYRCFGLLAAEADTEGVGGSLVDRNTIERIPFTVEFASIFIEIRREEHDS